jgi:hypothetical protein
MKNSHDLFWVIAAMVITIGLLFGCQPPTGTVDDNGGGLTPPQTVTIPIFNPVAGTYTTTQSVEITTTDPMDASIRYTTDGSTPNEFHGTVYSGPVDLNADTTLNAVGYKSGYNASAVGTANYTILQPDIDLLARVGATMESYASGQTVNFGTVRVSDNDFQKDVTFRIDNPAGGGILYLNGAPDYVALTQSESYYSLLGSQPISPIQPGNYEEFVIRFDADGQVGSKGSQISIASNDPDESPYLLNLTCSATS